MKTFAISLLLVTALIRIETALSSSHLDDEVPTEKAKKPKLKPPTHLPEVTHRVYMDVGELSTQDNMYNPTTLATSFNVRILFTTHLLIHLIN